VCDVKQPTETDDHSAVRGKSLA